MDNVINPGLRYRSAQVVVLVVENKLIFSISRANGKKIAIEQGTTKYTVDNTHFYTFHSTLHIFVFLCGTTPVVSCLSISRSHVF